MSEEIPEIPATVDELVGKIDTAKAEKPSPETVEKLKKLAREMTAREPVLDEDGDGYDRARREAHYKLIDEKEAHITTYFHSSGDETDTLISTVERIKDKNDMTHAIRRSFFIRGDEMEVNTHSFMEVDGNNISEADADAGYEDSSLTQEEAEAAHRYLSQGREMDWKMGMYDVSNEEIVNLMRLLKTAEPIVRQES